ncbi:MAG: hypothetical protein K2J82_07845 [Muribaculaceae bacterium]|nr:hypothetical protein [Muribaculaceae bacterium]
MGEIIRHKANLVKNAPNTSASISPLGSDPLSQVYVEETKEYVPDHTLVPLTLVPEVLADGVDVSSSVTSQSWWKVNLDGSETQITSSTTGYELVAGSTPLRLKLNFNTPSSNPLQLIYRYTAGGLSGTASVTLKTTVNPAPAPVLEIDSDSAVAWNPFNPESNDTLTITPAITANGHTGLTVRWRKKEGSNLRAIDTTDPKDIELSFSGNALKINRRWMGNRLSVVCELLKGSTVISQIPVTVSRRIPDFKARLRMSSIFSEADSKVYGKAEITTGGNVLANPSQEIRITWYESNAAVGEGNSHEYSVKGKSEVPAGMSVEDRGAWCLAVDGDGKYLTDADGKYLLIR